jgi:hypothetical protein
MVEVVARHAGVRGRVPLDGYVGSQRWQLRENCGENEDEADSGTSPLKKYSFTFHVKASLRKTVANDATGPLMKIDGWSGVSGVGGLRP